MIELFVKSLSIHRRPAHEIIQYPKCLFFIGKHIFCHLKMEIALAIPALNEWKIKTNNSAAQGLKRLLLKGLME